MHLRRILQLAATAALVSGDASVATALEPAQATDVSTRRLPRNDAPANDDSEERMLSFRNLFKKKPMIPGNGALQAQKAEQNASKKLNEESLNKRFNELKLHKSDENIFAKKEMKTWIETMDSYNFKHEDKVTVFSFLKTRGYTDKTLAQAVEVAIRSKDQDAVALGIKVGNDLRKSWGNSPAPKLDASRKAFSDMLVKEETSMTMALVNDGKLKSGEKSLDEVYKKLVRGTEKTKISTTSSHVSKLNWAIAHFNSRNQKEITLFNYLRTQGFSDEELAQVAIAVMKSGDKEFTEVAIAAKKRTGKKLTEVAIAAKKEEAMLHTSVGIQQGKKLQENWAYISDGGLQPYQKQFNNQLDMLETRFLVRKDAEKRGKDSLDKWFKKLQLVPGDEELFTYERKLNGLSMRLFEFNKKYGVNITVFNFLRAQGFTDEILAKAAIYAMNSDTLSLIEEGHGFGRILQKSWTYISDTEFQPYQKELEALLGVSKKHIDNVKAQQNRKYAQATRKSAS